MVARVLVMEVSVDALELIAMRPTRAALRPTKHIEAIFWVRSEVSH